MMVGRKAQGGPGEPFGAVADGGGVRSGDAVFSARLRWWGEHSVRAAGRLAPGSLGELALPARATNYGGGCRVVFMGGGMVENGENVMCFP